MTRGAENVIPVVHSAGFTVVQVISADDAAAIAAIANAMTTGGTIVLAAGGTEAVAGTVGDTNAHRLMLPETALNAGGSNGPRR